MNKTHRRTALTFSILMIASVILPIMTTVAATGMNDVKIESNRNDNTWGAQYWAYTEVMVGDVVEVEINSDNLTTNDDYALTFDLYNPYSGNSFQTGNWNWTAMNNASTESFNFTVPDTCSLEMSADLYVTQNNGTNQSWESDSYFGWDVVDCTDPDIDLTGQYDDGTWGPMQNYANNITAAVGDTRMLYVNSSDLTQGETYAIHFGAYDCDWNDFWPSATSIVSFTATGATDSRSVNVTMPDTCEVNFMSNLYLMNSSTNSSSWLSGSDFGWQITNFTNPLPVASSWVSSGYVGDMVAITIESVNLTVGVDYELEVYVSDSDWNTVYSNTFAWNAMANTSSEQFSITLPDSCWIGLYADLYEDTGTNGSNTTLTYLNSDHLTWSVTDCSDPVVTISGYHDNGTWAPVSEEWWNPNNISANVGDTRMLEISSTGLALSSDFELIVDVYDDDYNTFDNLNWSWNSSSNASTEFINVTMPNTCSVTVEASLYQTTSFNNTIFRDDYTWTWEISDCSETGVTVIGELNNGSWGEYDYWDTPEAWVGDTIMLEFESDGLTYGEDYSLLFNAHDDDDNSFDYGTWNWTAYSNSSTEYINITMPDTCFVHIDVNLFSVDNSTNGTNQYWEGESEWGWDIHDCTPSASASVTMFGEIHNGTWDELSYYGPGPASVGDVIYVDIESHDLELDVNYSLEIQLNQDSDLINQIYYNWTAYSSTSTEWFNFTIMDYCSYSMNAVLYSDDGDGWLSYEDYDSSYWSVNDCTRPGIVIEGEHANGSWGPMEYTQDSRINSWNVGDQVTYSVYAYDLDSAVNYTMEIQVNDLLGSNLFTANHNLTVDMNGEAGPYNISLVAPDTCNIAVGVNLFEIEDGWNNHVNGAYWNNGVADCTQPDISLMGATGTDSLDHIDWDEDAMINEDWAFEMSVSNLLPGTYTHKLTIQDMWGDMVQENVLNETRDATQQNDITTFQTTYTFGNDCRYTVRATVYVQVQTDRGDEFRQYGDRSANFDINDCSRPDMTISGEHSNGSWGPQGDEYNVTATVGDNVSVDVELDNLEIGTVYRLDVSWWNGSLWEGTSTEGSEQWNATANSITIPFNKIVTDSCEMKFEVLLLQIRNNNEWSGEQRAELDYQEFEWDITDASENCPPLDEPFAVNFGIEMNMHQNEDNITGQVTLNYTLTDWFRLMFDTNKDGTFDQTEIDSFLSELEGDDDMDVPIEMYLDDEKMGEPDSIVVTYTILNGIGDWDDGMNWNLIMAIDIVLEQSNVNHIEVEVFDPAEFGEDREGIAMFSLDASFSSYIPGMVITSVEMGSIALNHTDSTVSTSFASEDLEMITIIIEDPNAIDDADGDGVEDADDLCPNTDTISSVDLNGCAANQLDADSDGIMDDADMCADTPSSDLDIDVTGCGESQRDADGDGINDANDLCPNTPSTALAVDTDGCSQDDDGDGWSNEAESNCNTSANDTSSIPNDFDGDGLCDFVDFDDDNDGWTDANETDCGTDGLNDNSTPLDSDGDGICDMVDLTPYPNANMLPSCSVAYSMSSTVSFMGTSIETRMDGGTTMSTPLSGSFDISLPVGSYMIFIECTDPDGDDMTVTITEGSNTAQTIPLGDSFYSEMNFTLTEDMVGSGEDIRLQWSDSGASGEIRMSVSVIAADLPIDITPEEVEEGGLPGFTGMLGVLSLLGAAIIQRRRN